MTNESNVRHSSVIILIVFRFQDKLSFMRHTIITIWQKWNILKLHAPALLARRMRMSVVCLLLSRTDRRSPEVTGHLSGTISRGTSGVVDILLTWSFYTERVEIHLFPQPHPDVCQTLIFKHGQGHQRVGAITRVGSRGPLSVPVHVRGLVWRDGNCLLQCLEWFYTIRQNCRWNRY